MKFAVTVTMVLDDQGEGVELSDVDRVAQESITKSLAPLIKTYGAEFIDSVIDSVIELYGPSITVKRETLGDDE